MAGKFSIDGMSNLLMGFHNGFSEERGWGALLPVAG